MVVARASGSTGAGEFLGHLVPALCRGNAFAGRLWLIAWAIRATILAVSVDDSWDAIRKFFPSGTALTVLLDPTRQVPASFGTSQFPESFLIDPQRPCPLRLHQPAQLVHPRSRRLHRRREIGEEVFLNADSLLSRPDKPAR
jgi:hypothetical protein